MKLAVACTLAALAPIALLNAAALPMEKNGAAFHPREVGRYKFNENASVFARADSREATMDAATVIARDILGQRGVPGIDLGFMDIFKGYWGRLGRDTSTETNLDELGSEKLPDYPVVLGSVSKQTMMNMDPKSWELFNKKLRAIENAPRTRSSWKAETNEKLRDLGHSGSSISGSPLWSEPAHNTRSRASRAKG